MPDGKDPELGATSPESEASQVCHHAFSRIDDTFTGPLAMYLNTDTEIDVEVVNAGVVGFGPDQILIRLGHELPIYQPDVIVFHVFADNDFGDIVRNRLLELDDHGGLRRTTHWPTVDQAISGREHLRQVAASLLTVRTAATLLRRLGSAAEAGSVSEEGLRLELLKSETLREYQVYKEGRRRQFSHFADHYDFDLATDPDAESSKVKRDLMAGVLASADSLAKSAGVALLVVIQPSVIDVAPENVPFDVSPLREYGSYQPSNLTNIVD